MFARSGCFTTDAAEPEEEVRKLVEVHPTCYDPNTPPAATPLVSGPVIRLPGQHGKVRRDGYCRRPALR
jgi:hypothetical protein